MKTRTILTIVTMSALAISTAAAIAASTERPLTAPSPVTQSDEEMKELKKKFEARYEKVKQLKSAGVVGETEDGFLDFVKERNPDAAATVEEENADRRKLYDLIAKKEGVTADVVAKRNAQRNFEKARKGEWIKKGGKWEQK